MSCCRLRTFLFLLFTVAFPALTATLPDYAGQYVLRLGTRNFLVLNLRDDQGAVTGSLSRPRHASLGSSFSSISSEVLTEPITSAVLQQDHMHLVTKNPTDSSDTDAFDLTLLPPNHASLKLSGVPIDPWILTRVPSSPILSVATNWDAHCTYYPDEAEQSNPEMHWFGLAFYGELASVAQSFEKGDNIDVVGTLQQRTFTPKDGSQRTVYEIVVQHAHIIAKHRRATAEAEADAQDHTQEQEEVDAWAIL